MEIHTWGHVESRAASVVTGNAVRGGKSKVGKLDGTALVGDQDILRLQIAMVDSHGMTEQDGIQDLKERMFGEIVVSDKTALFSDVGEEVAFRTKLEHHKGAVRAVENAYQGDHVGVLTSSMVKSYLSTLDPTLTSIKASFGKSLDGIRNIGQDIDGLVDNSKSADSKD